MMDAERALSGLRRMRKHTERLKKAVRFTTRGGLKRWSESELLAHEHKLQTDIDVLDFAIEVLENAAPEKASA